MAAIEGNVTKRIISFSLYGDKENYHRGAIYNLNASKEIYPDWTCRFYVSQEIPLPIVNELFIGGAEVIRKNRQHNADGMFWRFLPATEKDIDLLIVRDVDTVVSMREKYAVDEWAASNKKFHIIRDLPIHRRRILGGLWGCRPKHLDLSAKLITDWNAFEYGDDQQFLSQHIHPIIKNDVLIHSDFSAYDDEIITPFPTPRKRLEWVGMPTLRPRALAERQKFLAKTYGDFFDLKI
jgi:hypothetical protein